MRTGAFCRKLTPVGASVPGNTVLLVTCEHASAHVPGRVRHCFSRPLARRDLNSHRGFDIGAVWVARQVARAAGVPCIEGRVTRLLIDLNRSPHHRQLFSEYSRPLPNAQKRWLLEAHYWPHQQRVIERIEGARRAGALAVHIAVHSFTPVLDTTIRNADVGLLYDPRRKTELKFACSLQRYIGAKGGLRVRRNYPYRGVADGLPTLLRRRFSSKAYLGLELELNQALLATRSKVLVAQLLEGIRQALRELR